jgi:stearoyl-CoA desaturase (delta-9 desaturase)
LTLCFKEHKIIYREELSMFSQLKNILNANKFRIFLGLIYLTSFYGIFMLFNGVSLWWLLAGLVWSKLIQLIGHSIGMHRYFSHKSFNTTPFGEKLMAWTSLLLGVGSPIQYARNHRQHHKVTDKETDWHSPVVDGELYTALGIWEFNSLKWFMDRGGMTPRDLIVHPTYRFIHDHYYKIWAALTAVTLLIDWRITVFLLAVPSWIYHVELNVFVNWIGHTHGYRNFDTEDRSKNNGWVHLWTLGEGLHNNHHANANCYDFAVKDSEAFDVSAWVIDKFLAVPGENTERGRIRIDG